MGKKKFPEVDGRIFDRVYVCMNCNATIRADEHKVKAKKIKCRKCKRTNLRKKRK